MNFHNKSFQKLNQVLCVPRGVSVRERNNMNKMVSEKKEAL